MPDSHWWDSESNWDILGVIVIMQSIVILKYYINTERYFNLFLCRYKIFDSCDNMASNLAHDDVCALQYIHRHKYTFYIGYKFYLKIEPTSTGIILLQKGCQHENSHTS